MLRFKFVIITALVAAMYAAAPVQQAEAGPLLDWFRGLRDGKGCGLFKRDNDLYRPNYTTAYSNPCGLQPGQCQTTCMKTCNRTVVNYVPYTAYRTQWERVPVTQYRPVTNSDPCTGCTVTCMRPCTTYTYQMKRVPYTTYRPCYRTETYRVPVTTITNDCNTCAPNAMAPNACSTCNTGNVNLAPQTVTQPSTTNSYYNYPNGSVTVPGGTLNTEGGYTAPANTTPELNANPTSSQRPMIDRLNNTFTQQTTWPKMEQPRSPTPAGQVPAVINFDDKTAQSTVRQRWGYSPVRLASYTTSVERQPETYTAPVTARPAKASVKNEGWESVDW